MKKNIKRSLSAICTSAMLLFPKVADSDGNFFVEYGLGIETRLIKMVDKIPLQIRDVPQHPDDNYGNVVQPIKPDYVELWGDHLSLKTKGGFRNSLKDIILISAGVGLDMNFYQHEWGITERDYSGERQAFTYYAVAQSKTAALS